MATATRPPGNSRPARGRSGSSRPTARMRRRRRRRAGGPAADDPGAQQQRRPEREDRCREQAPDPSGVEGREVDATPAFQLAHEQGGDDEARDDEEDVHAREAAREQGRGRMEGDDEGDRETSEAFDVRPEVAFGLMRGRWTAVRGRASHREGAGPPGATDSAAGHRPSEAASRLARAAADERARATLWAARLAGADGGSPMRRSWDRSVPESPRYPSLVVGTSDAVSRNARYTDRSISHSPEVA